MKHIASTLAVAASVALAGRDQPGVRFADVAGINEAVQELEEVAEFLKHPDKFSALGARIPRGVLLVGPPGSGKTLLARAVAGEAGIPFFSTAGSAFVEMFAGVGASRVRDLFAQAKSKAPCIVFVDEIDAVGRQRGTGRGGVNGEREQTLNQLLVEMDGFDSSTNVIVIGATNRPDVLDSALLQLSAYHEAGHAVVGRFVSNHDPLHGISITSRGMLGGRTRFLPPEDRNYLNRSQLNAMLASALGGQAAELMVFGEISTSARDDIQKATHIARRMVTQYGMSERLGPVGARNDYSDKIAEAIDDEIRGLVDEAKAQAISIVTGHAKSSTASRVS